MHCVCVASNSNQSDYYNDQMHSSSANRKHPLSASAKGGAEGCHVSHFPPFSLHFTRLCKHRGGAKGNHMSQTGCAREGMIISFRSKNTLSECRAISPLRRSTSSPAVPSPPPPAQWPSPVTPPCGASCGVRGPRSRSGLLFFSENEYLRVNKPESFFAYFLAQKNHDTIF